MLQLNPSLMPSDIYEILAETAVSMSNPYYHPSTFPDDQFNYATGAGLIQAKESSRHRCRRHFHTGEGL